jgi:hypothetical protein
LSTQQNILPIQLNVKSIFKKICRMGKIFAAPAKYSANPAKFLKNFANARFCRTG